MSLSYAVVTPVRNEAENLRRLAESLRAQTAVPAAWMIVETGSQDSTPELAKQLAERDRWVSLVEAPEPHARGGPIVRAFQAGVATLAEPVEVIVKADGDISLEADYFEKLLRRFEADPRLGIASGTCLEEQDGEWRPRHVTGNHVWGACRAYRAACLAEVSPLEERMGWDGIDAFKAKARGWQTTTFADLAFRHHRREGERDGRWEAWAARGRAAHYMGYRPAFLVIRALHHARREPAAVAMIAGWAQSALSGEPLCDDAVARAELRRQQRLRELPARALEALGRQPERLSP
jgi:glycosyltransferase involved in cell wall biosynthesis